MCIKLETSWDFNYSQYTILAFVLLQVEVQKKYSVEIRAE